MGASLAVHHHVAHDLAQYGSADDVDRLIEQISEAAPATGRVVALAGDLAEPSASEELVAAASDFSRTPRHLGVQPRPWRRRGIDPRCHRRGL